MNPVNGEIPQDQFRILQNTISKICKFSAVDVLTENSHGHHYTSLGMCLNF